MDAKKKLKERNSRRLQALARRLEAALEMESPDEADKVWKTMNKIRRGSGEKALDAINAGDDPAGCFGKKVKA